MVSTKILSAFIMFSMVLSLTATAAEDAATPQIAGKPADVQYPFIATVTGNNVYVRSGKGTAYYHCSKLNTNDNVTVIEEVFGWAKVVPPEGSYSWIHKDYVDVKKDTPKVGVLNGDNVRVWAGSDDIEPMRSSSMQTKLNTGEIVELLPSQPETGDYYKIKSPVSAYLWINCEFLKYSSPVQTKKPTAIPAPPVATGKPDATPSNEKGTPTFTNLDKEKSDTEGKASPEDEAGKDTPEKTGDDELDNASETLKKCYALDEKIDQEVEKPQDEQDYSDIRKELEEIKESTDEEKAATYAQVLLERVQRCELSISVGGAVDEQEQELAKTKEQIEKARQEKLKDLPKDTSFAYSGVLDVSHVYTQKTGQKRYTIKSPSGKILCYVVGASGEVNGQLESLIGKKVGIKGTVVNTQSLVTLFSATTVESLQ
ncbi:MAG: hypothetical protein ABFR90_07545 [Planctomycetota bacterium]